MSSTNFTTPLPEANPSPPPKIETPSVVKAEGGSAISEVDTLILTDSYRHPQEGVETPVDTGIPPFPEAGYVGPLADLADLYSRHYEPSKEFFYIDALTFVGNFLSGRVRLDFGGLPTQPRFFVLKIAPPGEFRKSTSTNLMQKFVAGLLGQVLDAQGRDATDITNEEAGRLHYVLDGVGSGEGLVGMLSRFPHITLVFDEYTRFAAKANADGSTLPMILNELHDKNEYANPTKGSLEKENLSILRGVHLSFSANMTTEQYENMDGDEFSSSGRFSRFFLMATNRLKRIACPVEPSEAELKPIRDKLAGYLSKLIPEEGKEQKEILLTMTPQARRLWIDWYHDRERAPEATRLDSIALRLMSVLAFTSGKNRVDRETMEAVLAIVNHQLTVRKVLKPSTGKTPFTKLWDKILHQLSIRGPLTRTQLQQRTNAARDEGIDVFNKVLNSLIETKMIVSGKKGNGVWYRLPNQAFPQ
jgi:hypothetical protein